MGFQILVVQFKVITGFAHTIPEAGTCVLDAILHRSSGNRILLAVCHTVLANYAVIRVGDHNVVVKGSAKKCCLALFIFRSPTTGEILHEKGFVEDGIQYIRFRGGIFASFFEKLLDARLHLNQFILSKLQHILIH
jgi:hypothetical protein